MEACKRGTQKQKQRVEEQQLGLTVVLPLLIFSSRPSFFPQKEIGEAHHQNAFFIITRTISIPYDNQFAEAIVYIQ